MYCKLSGACVPDLPDGYKYVDCEQGSVMCRWCRFYNCKQHAELMYGWGGAIGYTCHKCIATNQCIYLYDECIPASSAFLESFVKIVQEIHSNDLTKNAKY